MQVISGLRGDDVIGDETLMSGKVKQGYGVSLRCATVMQKLLEDTYFCLYLSHSASSLICSQVDSGRLAGYQSSNSLPANVSIIRFWQQCHTSSFHSLLVTSAC